MIIPSEVWNFLFRNSTFMFTEQPKLVSQSNRTIDVEEGEPVTLNCKVTGNPVPSIMWMHNGRILPQKASVLKISKIQLSQAGIYNCTATNQAGNVSESFVVNIVRYKPYKDQSASSKSLVQTTIGQQTILTCAVDAKPPAEFFWRKLGKITAGVISTENLSTLTFTPKDDGDFGFYFCYAGNKLGITTITFRVIKM